MVHIFIASDCSGLVDRRPDIRLPVECQSIRPKHVEKRRALGCKLATDLCVGMPRIIHVSSKANQHVESKVVIREHPCFTSVEVRPVVCGKSILLGPGVRSEPVFTCSVIGAAAVFSRPVICRSTVGGTHAKRDNDTSGCDDYCTGLDDDSNGLCGHTVRVLVGPIRGRGSSSLLQSLIYQFASVLAAV